MLCRLAWGNVRRAGRDYLVYLLTLTLGVTVFYAFNTISMQLNYAGFPPGSAESLSNFMAGLTVFLAMVMGFLMVYANNFIMKRRKKQFGLYQLLGMERGQVAAIMALECAIVSAGALIVGLACGIGLSQLMTFFTASLFRTQISDFHFFVSADAALLTVGCLVATFLVTLVFNLRVVARAKVIELIGAHRANETVRTRNALVSAALFVVGAVLVGVAYARLLHDGMPLGSADDGGAFLLTTLLVIVGTVLLFFGLSGFLLKVLQGARGLYWRGLNMFTLRQLAAKVNTVSVSMAVISMILFLALTSVTTGMAINSVMNEGADRGTPADYALAVNYYSTSTLESVRQSVAEGTAVETADDLARITSTSEPVDLMTEGSRERRSGGAQAIDLASIAGKHVQVNVYDSTPAEGAEPYVTIRGLAQAAGREMPKALDAGNPSGNALGLMSESDYNSYLEFRGLAHVSLGANGYLITSDSGTSVVDIYNAALAQGVTLRLGSHELSPAADHVDIDASTFTNNATSTNGGTVIVPDAVLSDLGLSLHTSYLLLDYAPGVDAAQADKLLSSSTPLGTLDDSAGHEVGFFSMDMTRTNVYESTNTTNGLISYLAIYIGFVLVVACGAILTIQQLSGVADAVPSYRLLSELGSDGSALRGSLLAQQGVFFAFPLVVGVAHSAVALRVIVDVVQTLGSLSIGATAWLTCAIFVAAYGGYFVVTYLMGSGIIREATRVHATL